MSNLKRMQITNMPSGFIRVTVKALEGLNDCIIPISRIRNMFEPDTIDEMAKARWDRRVANASAESAQTVIRLDNDASLPVMEDMAEVAMLISLAQRK